MLMVIERYVADVTPLFYGMHLRFALEIAAHQLARHESREPLVSIRSGSTLSGVIVVLLK